MPASRTVLIVDDSATVREIVKIYLMSKRLDFVEADNGERALQLVRLMPVRLVIADIKMPGMDGLALCRAMRQSDDPRVKVVPIILLTGEREPNLEKKGYDAGATGFLHKPVTAAALGEMVDRFLLPEHA